MHYLRSIYEIQSQSLIIDKTDEVKLRTKEAW